MPIIRVLPPGSASNFARNSRGKAYGLNGDNQAKIPLVFRPTEVLAGSAIPSSCVHNGIHEILELFVIPAGTLGPNSILQIEPLWTFSSSANTKILKINIGSVTVYNVTRTTSVKEAPLVVLANRNSLTSQIQPYDGAHVTAGTSAPVTYSIDFSVSNLVTFTGRRLSSSDSLTLEYFRVLHLVGD